MAIKIGITGGIGSGKSVVSRLLEVMGVPVYISDMESKRLTQEDVVIRRQLIALLGSDIYKDGILNRSLLASYIFGNPQHQKEVNGIIHPRVKADFKEWVGKHADAEIVGIESAILVEAGLSKDVDQIIMVYAPLELRLERAMQRDCSSRELIEKRVQSQMDDEQKKQYADTLVYNDNLTPLIPQLLRLIDGLRKN